VFVARCISSNRDDGNLPEAPSNSNSSFRGFGLSPQDKNVAPGEILRETLGEVSSADGRVSERTNVIFGTDLSEEKWRELDSQVNEYPGQQTFKAIGVGGDDFVVAMIACVEAVIGKVHNECVSRRLSAKGNYISVTVGPVWVEKPDQLLDIYNKMKEDGRLKYFI